MLFIRIGKRVTSQNIYQRHSPFYLFPMGQTPSDKYLGSEFAHKIDGDLENIKLILDEKLRLLSSAYFSFCRTTNI